MGLRTTPWRHQVEAFEFAKRRRGALLAVAMGGGKTAIAAALLHEWRAQRTLVLCPKSVIPAWPLQLERHLVDPPRCLPLTDGTTAQKAALAEQAWADPSPLVLVVNYEAIIQPALRSWLARRTWDCVLLDESHRIKSPTGETQRVALALGKLARRRLCLTGTPMPHSPLDIFSQARFLNPSVYGWKWGAFRERYAVMDPFIKNRVLRLQNLDELEQKLGAIAFRATSDVLDLPPAHHVALTCTLSARARTLYSNLEDDFYGSLEAFGGGSVTASIILTKLLRLQQIAGGHVADDDGAVRQVDDGKASLLADLLDGLDATEPVVVFARFRAELDAARVVAEQQGRAYRELSGRVNELARWQAGDGTVLGVQIQAGGVGIDLTRARYCVYFSTGYALGDYEQSLARVHRPGQERPVTYFHLLAVNTIDERIQAALAARKQVVETLLDGLKRTQGETRLPPAAWPVAPLNDAHRRVSA